MDKSSAYNRYKRLKDKLDYTYKGYNLKHLIPGYLNLIYDGVVPSYTEVAKEFLRSRISHDLLKAVNIQSPLLITYLLDRSDYKELAFSAKSYYSEESEVINILSLPTVKKSFFSRTYFNHFFKAFRLVFTRSLELPFALKLHLAANIIKIFNQITLLEGNRSEICIKRYVCFNSAFRDESLLTEFFNKREIETVTLQHGIFCEFKLFVPFDFINFDNFIARRMLCWGQSTVDFLTEKGVDPSRLIVVGNLKYKNFKIDKVYQNFSNCLVLLGRGLYVDTNDKLLEVLAEYNRAHANKIVFHIKKHPLLPQEAHLQFANEKNKLVFLGKELSVQKVLESPSVDFSIAVNTTAYYESLALGKPCLRWSEAENEMFYGMDDKFSSLEEFENKLEQWKSADQEQMKKEMKDVIRYIFNPTL